MTEMKKSFSPADREAFAPTGKVGMIACLDFEGLPHICFLNTLQAIAPRQLIFGEFVTGSTKAFLRKNGKAAFMVLTLQKDFWRGKAVWTHSAKSGLEYERLNSLPMFRYNTYFGINTVHYLDLVETSSKEPLPMTPIIADTLRTMLAKGAVRTGNTDRILNSFAESLFNALGSLKFLSYAGADGFPTLVPVVQCQAADSRRLAFSTGVYTDELRRIPAGAKVAVMGMTLGIEDVLVRGTFNGYSRHRGVELGTIDIDWVYNSMPPAVGQVYPPLALEPVTSF